MANAKKLPSGNYRVQVSKSIDGKLVKKSFTHSEKRIAEKMAAEWQSQIDAQAVEDLTFKNACERYIESKRKILSPGTVRLYESIPKNHLKSILNVKVSKLTMELIQKEINACAADSSPKTVRNVHGFLSVVLRMFRPEFILTTTLPQKKPTQLCIPDDKDIEKLMEAVKGTDMEIPILLATFGPLRRGEICALTSDDIHGNVISINKAVVRDENGKTVVKVPKTSSSYREIEFPDFVIEKLKGINGKITNISPAHITRRFKKILINNNIPEFRFHDLRHYNVSVLHANNVPDKYIMARGGWKTNHTMNNVYNHTLKSFQSKYDEVAFEHFKSIYK